MSATDAMARPAERPAEHAVALPAGLAGIWSAAAAPAATPACVVLLHGFGGHRDETGGLFATQARHLAERGIASLRFDFPGCGRSAGDFADITYTACRHAAEAAIGFARARLGADTAIGLLGYSFGAAIAAETAADAPDVRARALWAPVADPHRDMVAILGAARAEEAERLGSVSFGWGDRTLRLNAGFFRDLAGAAPLDRLAAYAGAVLAVAGQRDPLARSLPAIRAAARRASRYEETLLPDADHGFGATLPAGGFSDTLARATAEFFAATLPIR